ncbi:M4 family metallopeptidase [Ideonella sp. B7]|uniref:M4 family metallopeptidase n=1 Tax=Ideonella benzenivorans TaxID=2831643 RepID=UPI001CEC4ACF|nr:M4 family metallopeptidase [Ideonella benzenivorans]MCA6218300.1 M4 family metallopeptidase [Ideonella benzenivorans]
MKPTVLHLAALATLTACLAPAALAAQPAAGHPAVARALAHLKAQAGLVAGQDDFVARDLVVDADGTEHVRFDRTFRGLRVLGGDVVVHESGRGLLRGLSRTFGGALALSTTPALAADGAATFAKGRFEHRNAQVARKELVVYARNGQPQLAWDVLVTGERADQTPSRMHFIVSAAGKKLLDGWDEIENTDTTVTGHTLFSGSETLHADKNKRGVYTLVDATRGGHKVVTMKNTKLIEAAVKSSTASFGDSTLSDTNTVAADAAYGQNMTWDYFLNTFGRNGIADDGAGAYSRVHYGKNYVNAFWSDDCFCMTYGDGNTTQGYYPLVALDVAGHEMTHGVTSRTANLTYSGESGGLNEATSDIMGTMVEFFANNPNDTPDYLIGEEIFVQPGNALRSMVQPSSDGYSADCWYSGLGSLDVHYSSGVANHFYYLLAEGTTAGAPSKTCVAGNTKKATGTGTVTGIGRDKAAKIWYRALTVYMTSSTNYAAARTATVSAATDLYGAGSAEVAAVQTAWTATNVN